MKAVLVFIDGIICDYRQRQHLSGTPDFYKREVMMKDAPTPDSVRCLLELSQRYQLVYLTARPETAKAATEEWLTAMNFPKGPLFVGQTPADRLALAPALLVTALIALPYVDRKRKGVGVWFSRDRKVALTVFTLCLSAAVVLTVIGTAFRGPNWAFQWPWKPIHVEERGPL